MPAEDRLKTAVFLGADADYMYRFRLPLMEELHERGYRIVTVATVPAGFDPELFRSAGFEIVDWPLKRGGFNPLSDLRDLAVPWRVLRRERPQLLFVHTLKPVIYGTLIGWLTGVPRRTAMIPGLGYAFIGGTGLKRKLASVVASLGYRLALARAHTVIFQNPEDRDALTERGTLPRFVETKVVNGSGVDMCRFAPAPLPPPPPTFLMVARLLRDKGVREFVEAARLVKAVLPEARFILVGEGDPHNPAAIPPEEVAAWRSEGHVEIRGRLADPREAFAACHVFVLPSYREGIPRTNLEAMATGRAVITTDVAGCRQTVTQDVNGLLVPPRDPKALAAAMIELGGDLDRAGRMGEEGLRRCREQFELEIVVRDTADALEGRCCEQGGTAGQHRAKLQNSSAAPVT